jgi:hypothetical protein
MVKKLASKWWTWPLAAFGTAALLTIFAGPTVGFSILRLAQAATGGVAPPAY